MDFPHTLTRFGCRAGLALVTTLLLAGCGSGNDGTLDVALIGTPEAVFTEDLRLSATAQHLRAATQSGLVAFDAQGEVVPALAETWLPTEDGMSYVFRLRDIPWPDGSPMTAQSARSALLEAMDDLAGTSLAQDLAPIAEVRAMAGRVIEIRLSVPEPDLLQLLAQPELALRHSGGATGPMTLVQGVETNDGEERSTARLEFRPPIERGLPMDEDWQEEVQPVEITVASAAEAIAMFDSGEVELVLGGDLGSLPLVETGPLTSGTLRIDSTIGLFGLHVRRAEGLLGNDGVREALAMAIDRTALLSPFNIGGWAATTRPVSPGLPGDTGLVLERWQDTEIAELREEAAARVAAWRRQFDEGDPAAPAILTVSMDEGPGWDLLLRGLSQQLAQIGIRLERAESLRDADLVLVDRIARYPAPRWFLGQFHCGLRRGLCSEDADRLLAQAAAQANPALRATMMAQAEARLTLENVYIPFGSPLRWSLVRGNVDGFEANAYAFHPLPPMAQLPR
ncbi:MAG: ABC transporter substrate-binding protein [Erythrobacter sp.]|nr:MAG: ABC transporter substrate-binding protein [Erythrobacter sp.]